MQPRTATNPASGPHLPYEARHIDDIEWETIRWPGETGKMLFHPRPERPTEPNAGILRLEPGAHHPLHHHDFAQVWYILSGEFRIDDNIYPAGTMIFHPDPHFEGKFETETGGDILIVQYPGPTTGRSTPDASTWRSAAISPRSAPTSDQQLGQACRTTYGFRLASGEGNVGQGMPCRLSLSPCNGFGFGAISS